MAAGICLCCSYVGFQTCKTNVYLFILSDSNLCSTYIWPFAVMAYSVFSFFVWYGYQYCNLEYLPTSIVMRYSGFSCFFHDDQSLNFDQSQTGTDPECQIQSSLVKKKQQVSWMVTVYQLIQSGKRQSTDSKYHVIRRFTCYPISFSSSN